MIAVVIPSFRVKAHILDVIARIGPECGRIYVVDDRCPEHSGEHVEASCPDPRVRVIYNQENLGVGGATMVGYEAAIADGAQAIVKIDGDGQMDAATIPRLVRPLLDGEADLVKGNRFFELEGLRTMPRIRLAGNAFLSFASKLASGYWNVFDPTNGFTAIHAAVAKVLPLAKVNRRWFFESDLLFHLGILRAVIQDVPMPATYGEERSSLVVHRVAFGFAGRHLVNLVKRIFYSYFLRDFNIASIELVLGLAFLGFGGWVGVAHWLEVTRTGVPATSGTVMLAALPVLLGLQLLIAFLSYDLQNVPRTVLHRRLEPASLVAESASGPPSGATGRPEGEQPGAAP